MPRVPPETTATRPPRSGKGALTRRPPRGAGPRRRKRRGRLAGCSFPGFRRDGSSSASGSIATGEGLRGPRTPRSPRSVSVASRTSCGAAAPGGGSRRARRKRKRLPRRTAAPTTIGAPVRAERSAGVLRVEAGRPKKSGNGPDLPPFSSSRIATLVPERSAARAGATAPLFSMISPPPRRTRRRRASRKGLSTRRATAAPRPPSRRSTICIATSQEPRCPVTKIFGRGSASIRASSAGSSGIVERLPGTVAPGREGREPDSLREAPSEVREDSPDGAPRGGARHRRSVRAPQVDEARAPRRSHDRPRDETVEAPQRAGGVPRQDAERKEERQHEKREEQVSREDERPEERAGRHAASLGPTRVARPAAAASEAATATAAGTSSDQGLSSHGWRKSWRSAP